MSSDFTSAERQLLAEAVEGDLGDPALWPKPGGYPASLALCVIDSVFSIGVKYQSVVNLVTRFRRYRVEQSGDADTDGVLELMGTFEHLGGPAPWADALDNHQRTSTTSGVLKSDAVLREAHSLAKHGIWTIQDLRTVTLEGRLVEVEKEWRRIPGQKSGISWNYFLMLARALPDRGLAAETAGVKPDRMIKRYVGKAIGQEEIALANHKVACLVRAVADAQDWDIIALDHAIWRFESGRSFEEES